MSTSDWLRNARGEWFVITQMPLMLAVLVAPKLDGRNAYWSGMSGAIGGLLCIVGVGFAVLGSIALGRNLSPFPKPKEKGTLVESGIFSVVRHPIYSDFSLAAFGWSLIWNSIAVRNQSHPRNDRKPEQDGKPRRRPDAAALFFN